MNKKVFIISWVVSSILLFLYSYTQVDLSLTLSRASIYQTIEKSFQYIGWFNRPLSTYIYSAIILVMFALYILSIRWVRAKKLSYKNIWIVTIILAVILAFSYNAFSYDLFNYIFDAKIITHYHQNPYIHKALDFPGEPMLSFMHWTHRTYPYGPIWLLVTVPLSYIGLNYFLITFFLFKILAAVSFVVTTYFIGKIARITKYVLPEAAMAAFALNPLVIIESLVSAHNDIAMMAVAMGALYLFLRRRNVSAGVIFLLSVGIKFATLFLAPVLFWFLRQKTRDEKTYHRFFLSSILLMTIAIVAVTFRTTFQPWYLLEVLPFAALMAHKKYILVPVTVMSIFSLVQYIPYLYLGNFNVPVPSILLMLLMSSIIISAVGVLFSITAANKH